MMDFLTGTPNRKAFIAALARMMGDTNCIGKGLCLLMIEIDHFKRFNDRFGHMVGDGVLKFVARKLKSLLKGWDFFARLGGEEFVALLPFTELSGAQSAGENIWRFFGKSELKAVHTSDKLGIITVSIGAACFRPGEQPERFIARAGRALYFAKSNGRTRLATEGTWSNMHRINSKGADHGAVDRL